MAKKESVGKVTLLNVRASFLALFTPDSRTQDDGTIRETWKGNFFIPKDNPNIVSAIYLGKRMTAMEALKKAGAAARESKWGAESAAKKWPKLKADRVYLRDGDEETWDGYAGQHYISSNSPVTERPSVITNRKDGAGNWIEAEPGKKNAPYSGCYVNAVIEVWVQDNKHGKRLNCKLKAVQFFRDGDAFSANVPVDVNEEFTDDMAGTEGSIGGDFEADDDDDDLV